MATTFRVPLGYPRNDPQQPQNPTLLPNFDRHYASGNGTIDLKSPQRYLEDTPRVDATASVTLGGTVATGDVTTVTVTHPALTGGSLTESYTATGTDTVDSIAEELATQFLEAIDGQPVALEVLPVGGQLTFNWEGPIGNSAVLSATVQNAMTATLSPVSGDFSGGSGPVLVYSNFTFFNNNVTSNYWYGRPYSLGSDVITKMLTQGMPIY